MHPTACASISFLFVGGDSAGSMVGAVATARSAGTRPRAGRGCTIW